jgi:hypothetical protein
MMMNWKGLGRNLSLPKFKALSRNSPGGTEENHENLTRDIRSPGPGIETGTSQMRSRSDNQSALNKEAVHSFRMLVLVHTAYRTSWLRG